MKSIKDALREIEERKQKALEGSEGGDKEFTPTLFFKLPDSANGKTEKEITASMRAVIRPLEEGENIAFASVHPVDVDNRKWPIDIVCRDQDNSGEPCPGCEAGLPRKFKGWINVIWRNAPDFPLDEDTNKYITKVDYETLTKSDKLAVVSSGPRLFNRLIELDEDLEGLTGYDLNITREGTGLGTNYKIKKEKKSALSDEDKALAENKTDLSVFTRVPDYDEWLERAAGKSPSRKNDEQPQPSKSPLSRPDNIFSGR